MRPATMRWDKQRVYQLMDTPTHYCQVKAQDIRSPEKQASLLGELPNIAYDKSIGSSRCFKVAKARYSARSIISLVVVKVFYKSGDPLKKYARRLKHERDLLQAVPNILVYQRILETEKAGYIIRQWLRSNLYDRISTRPFLSVLEKKWIAFQLLSALQQAHELGVPHGDIKSENVLITSSLWVYLADFASFKPTYLPLNDPADFSFWYDSSGRRICYIAPERFYAPDNKPDTTAEDAERPTEQMDIFSLGCVLAELFADGSPPFTLSQIFRYRSGEYGPEFELYLRQIEDLEIVALIKQMLSLDPAQRHTCAHYIASSAFPALFAPFHSYLVRQGQASEAASMEAAQARFRHDASGSPQAPLDSIGVTSEQGRLKEAILLSDADLKLEMMAKDWAYLTSFCKPTPNDLNHAHTVLSQSTPIFPLHISLPGFSFRMPDSTARMERDADDAAALLLLNNLAPLSRNTSRPSSTSLCLNMLLFLSLFLTDETNSDRLLPYFVIQLSNESALMRAASVKAMTQVLSRLKVVSKSNTSLFVDYILPNTTALVTDAEPCVRIAYSLCIGHLVECSSRSLSVDNLLRSEEGAARVAETGQDESYDARLSELQTAFQEHLTPLLLTDSCNMVRKAMLLATVPLCLFFGRSKAADIILSNAITFLDDRDWTLREAFFGASVDLASCIGGQSLSDCILPMAESFISGSYLKASNDISEGLRDANEHVPVAVIQALKTLAELRFLKPNQFWPMLKLIMPLMLHPNARLRQAAIGFVSTLASQLSQIDRWAALYPMLRLILKADIESITSVSIDKALESPLPRQLYTSALDWATTSKSTATFWHSISVPVLLKDKGRSSSNSFAELHEEDARHMDRLRTLGMQKHDESALRTLRRYIFACSQARQRNDAIDPQRVPMGNLRLQDYGVSAEIILPYRLTVDSIEQRMSDVMEAMSPVDVTSPPGTPLEGTVRQMVGPKGVLAPHVGPSIGHSSLQVAGKISGTDSGPTEERAFTKETARALDYGRMDEHVTTLVKSIAAAGQAMGRPGEPVVPGPFIRRRSAAPQRERSASGKPNGLLIAHLDEHRGRVICLCPAPDNIYFLSAASDNCLKLWDCARLERNVTARSRHTFTFTSHVTALIHLQHQRSFICSTKQGKLFRYCLDVNLSTSLPKYGRHSIAAQMTYDQSSAYITCLTSVSNGNLYCGTSSAEILFLRCDRLQIRHRISIDKLYGTPLSILADASDLWLAVGTSRGFLLLIDVRFGLLVKSICTRPLADPQPIRSLHFHTQKGKDRWLVCAIGSSIETWDISTGLLTQSINLTPKDPGMPSEWLAAHQSPLNAASAIERLVEQPKHASQTFPPTEHALYVGREEMKDERAFTERGGLHASETLSSGELVSFPGDVVTYAIVGSTDSKLRYFDFSVIERSTVISQPAETGTARYTSRRIDKSDTSQTVFTETNDHQEGTRHRSTIIAQHQQNLLQAHKTAITAVTVLQLPHKAIVSADDQGIIKVFV